MNRKDLIGETRKWEPWFLAATEWAFRVFVVVVAPILYAEDISFADPVGKEAVLELAIIISVVIAFLFSLRCLGYLYRSESAYIRRLRITLVMDRVLLGKSTPITSRLGLVRSGLFAYAWWLWTFAVFYIQISRLVPVSFEPAIPMRFVDSLYFTVATATTVGFGDIRPVTQITRLAVTIQMLLGFAYVVFILSAAAGFSGSRQRTPRRIGRQSVSLSSDAIKRKHSRRRT